MTAGRTWRACGSPRARERSRGTCQTRGRAGGSRVGACGAGGARRRAASGKTTRDTRRALAVAAGQLVPAGAALADRVGRVRACLHGAVVDDRAARAGAVGGRGARGAEMLSLWAGARALVACAAVQVIAAVALGAGRVRSAGALFGGAV